MINAGTLYITTVHDCKTVKLEKASVTSSRANAYRQEKLCHRAALATKSRIQNCPHVPTGCSKKRRNVAAIYKERRRITTADD